MNDATLPPRALRRAGGDRSGLGSYLTRPAPVRRFENPSVLWLNHRWLRGNGVDPTNADERDEVERWLLRTFAATGPTFLEPEEVLAEGGRTGNETVLHCDRYGTPRGSLHGGSGRVAGVHGFEAKGIGRTPLAAHETDRFHADGVLWLEAAMREAVFSEIVADRFPHGAVPVIAILDTGRALRWRDGVRGPFRAILVRPTAVRLAHLQRSVFFGNGGRLGSDQHADAARVRDAWRWLDRQGADGAAGALTRTFRKLGEQYGCAHALRLWPGPFYSSNLAIDGRLLDFDGARAMPDWRHSRGTVADAGFGREVIFVKENARSLERLSSRHADTTVPSGDLVAAFDRGFKDGFSDAVVRTGSPRQAVIGFLFRHAHARVASASSLGGNMPGFGYPTTDRPGLYYDRFVSDATAAVNNMEPGSAENPAVVGEFIRQRLSWLS